MLIAVFLIFVVMFAIAGTFISIEAKRSRDAGAASNETATGRNQREG
jgi:hypothetical protein